MTHPGMNDDGTPPHVPDPDDPEQAELRQASTQAAKAESEREGSKRNVRGCLQHVLTNGLASPKAIEQREDIFPEPLLAGPQAWVDPSIWSRDWRTRLPANGGSAPHPPGASSSGYADALRVMDELGD
jgi:hypothetical protein